MNPLVLLPLVACSALAAPQHLIAAGLPGLHGAIVSHEVKAHIPEGITLKDASGVIPLAAPGIAAAAVAVPGYSVDGEVRQIHQEFAAPAEVITDVNALPVIGAKLNPIAYTTTGHFAGVAPGFLHAPLVAPAAVEIPEIKTVEVAAAPTLLSAGLVAAQAAPVALSNVNLNVPAPVPAGDAPPFDQLVQRIPVKALGRPVVSHTPLLTQVTPELAITEVKYDVAVPKPVYAEKEVTPVVYNHVAEPYNVPAPYSVPHPVPVGVPHPVPVGVPKPVHQHTHLRAPAAIQPFHAGHFTTHI